MKEKNEESFVAYSDFEESAVRHNDQRDSIVAKEDGNIYKLGLNNQKKPAYKPDNKCSTSRNFKPASTDRHENGASKSQRLHRQDNSVGLRMSKLQSDPSIHTNDDDFIKMCEQNMDIITNKYLQKLPESANRTYEPAGNGSYMRPIEYMLKNSNKNFEIDSSFTPFNP